MWGFFFNTRFLLYININIHTLCPANVSAQQQKFYSHFSTFFFQLSSHIRVFNAFVAFEADIFKRDNDLKGWGGLRKNIPLHIYSIYVFSVILKPFRVSNPCSDRRDPTVYYYILFVLLNARRRYLCAPVIHVCVTVYSGEHIILFARTRGFYLFFF